MIGSMFVGFIIGLIAGAITSRGERMGCIGKILLGWFFVSISDEKVPGECPVLGKTRLRKEHGDCPACIDAGETENDAQEDVRNSGEIFVLLQKRERFQGKR